MESIVSYIKNNIDPSTDIGSALRAAAEVEPIFTREDPEEIELKNKMEDLRKAEEEEDLLKISYPAFNSLPVLVQESIRLLNPLFWGGVYIRYSEFLSSEREALRYLGKNNSLAIYFEDGVYNLASLADHGVSWFTEYERRNAVRKVKSRKILRRYSIRGGELFVDDLSTTK